MHPVSCVQRTQSATATRIHAPMSGPSRGIGFLDIAGSSDCIHAPVSGPGGEPRKENVDDGAATASMRPCRSMQASPEKKTRMMMWIATQICRPRRGVQTEDVGDDVHSGTGVDDDMVSMGPPPPPHTVCSAPEGGSECAPGARRGALQSWQGEGEGENETEAPAGECGNGQVPCTGGQQGVVSVMSGPSIGC